LERGTKVLAKEVLLENVIWIGEKKAPRLNVGKDGKETCKKKNRSEKGQRYSRTESMLLVEEVQMGGGHAGKERNWTRGVPEP